MTAKKTTSQKRDVPVSSYSDRRIARRLVLSSPSRQSVVWDILGNLGALYRFELLSVGVLWSFFYKEWGVVAYLRVKWLCSCNGIDLHCY